MKNMINKIYLANRVAEKLSISVPDAIVIMEKFTNSLSNALSERDERIELRGFGIFRIMKKKTSVRRNPKTGEKVIVLPKKVVIFKPGKEFAEIVKYSFK